MIVVGPLSIQGIVVYLFMGRRLSSNQQRRMHLGRLGGFLARWQIESCLMTQLYERRCREPFGFHDAPGIAWYLLRISRCLSETLLLSRRLDT